MEHLGPATADRSGQSNQCRALTLSGGIVGCHSSLRHITRALQGTERFSGLSRRFAWHGAGQWFPVAGGSFTEQVETLERRSPGDIDVVTFVYTPDDFAPTDEQIGMLEHDAAKAQFLVDSYFVEINQLPVEAIVQQSAYWYSMWSHRRNQAWKGYLQIDLSPAYDADARECLTQLVDSQEMQP